MKLIAVLFKIRWQRHAGIHLSSICNIRYAFDSNNSAGTHAHDLDSKVLYTEANGVWAIISPNPLVKEILS